MNDKWGFEEQGNQGNKKEENRQINDTDQKTDQKSGKN